MSPKNLTICLLYTTYHSFVWDCIGGEIDGDEILVINFSKRPLIKRNANSRVIDRCKETKTAFLLKCIKIALRSKFLKYDLLLAHPDHLLGNTLFFGKNVKKITFIEDGILNYYDYTKSQAIQTRAIKRKWLTCFSPFQYYLYNGHHSGIDDCNAVEVSGWFSDPDNIVRKEKFKSVRKINFPLLIRKETNRNLAALFIDQPIEHFLSRELAMAIRQKSIKYLEENFKEVMIKNHPEHHASGLAIKNSFAPNFNQNMPVEELIFEICPDVVISYCSTALINISKISPSTQCVSIGMEEIVQEMPALIKVKKLFEFNRVSVI